MKRIGLIVCLACGMALPAKAQQSPFYYTTQDSLLVEACLREQQKHTLLPEGEQVLLAARLFLNVPYVAATLEKEPEGIVVNLQGLDCTTLVETALALTRSAQQEQPSFRSYCEELRQIRYRNGEVAYTQRLHYIADWKQENEKHGRVEDLSGKLPGSEPLALQLSFISSHPLSYLPLKNRPEWIENIRQQEKAANRRRYFYIPKESLPKAEADIQDGDIIGFVTSIPGLDVTHLGLACWKDGRLTFLHASSSARKVVVNPGTLQEYLQKMPKTKGIWLIRPVKVK